LDPAVRASRTWPGAGVAIAELEVDVVQAADGPRVAVIATMFDGTRREALAFKAHQTGSITGWTHARADAIRVGGPR